ncbi:MAG TPA: ABC transporter substrate-binding protein [Caldilineaceae bacterium]|nr:ABC transporter substrate-binding protein [Caldilineaceae bacterium]
MTHQRRSVRRVTTAVLWLWLLALVLTACQPSSPQAPAGEEAAPAEGAAEASSETATAELPADAAAEQILRINTGSTGSASFDFFPMAGGSDNQSWMPLLHTPPLYFDVNLELQPGVFDSWQSNEDFTEWVFTIDPRAKFSDGSPITATDVKVTWEAMADPQSGHGRINQYIGNVEGFASRRALETTEISGLVVVDDATIQVNLVNPDAIFHWRIATTHMNPLKAEMLEGADLDTFWLPENNPVYSGPYMLESYNPDLLEATFIPNPNWWMDEGPYLERIEMRFAPEPETLAVMLQNDQVDASLGGLPPTMREQFPDYFRPIKTFGFNTFWISVAPEPTNDPLVRKALTLAVDQEAVFQAMYPEGNAVPTNQIIDPDLPCQDTENSWYPYDPEAAREALAASSYGSAENLPKLRVTPRGTNAELNRGMEAVVEFWRQNLGITNVEFQQQPDSFGQDAQLINVSRDDVVIRFPDSATYMWTAAHSDGPIARAHEDPADGMLRGYSNPEVDALIEEALTLPPEDPRRCELTLQAQQLFMEDNPTILLGKGIPTINAREYVANYEKGPDVGLIAPWRIYIKEH